MPNKKMRFIKITRSDAGGCYVVRPNELLSHVDGELSEIEWDDPGTKVVLEIVEMTEGEFEGLPEFDGW